MASGFGGLTNPDVEQSRQHLLATIAEVLAPEDEAENASYLPIAAKSIRPHPGPAGRPTRDRYGRLLEKPLGQGPTPEDPIRDAQGYRLNKPHDPRRKTPALGERQGRA